MTPAAIPPDDPRTPLVEQLRWFRFLPGFSSGIAERDDTLELRVRAGSDAERVEVFAAFGVAARWWPADRPVPAHALPYVDPGYLDSPALVPDSSLVQPGLVRLMGSTGFLYATDDAVWLDLVDVEQRAVTDLNLRAAMAVEREIVPRLVDRLPRWP
ncbi:MAG: hypothetical protein ACTHMS_24030 [Jatrophihabitans sp.]|uniref:hypothetical protein n=1 Tax=Jatrophihabitans sp. TaxID=1932789 RepID=UPI003F7FB0C6